MRRLSLHQQRLMEQEKLAGTERLVQFLDERQKKISGESLSLQRFKELRGTFLEAGVDGEVAMGYLRQAQSIGRLSEVNNLLQLTTSAPAQRILHFIAAPSTEFERTEQHGTVPTRVEIMKRHSAAISRETTLPLNRGVSLVTHGLPVLFVLAAVIPMGIVSVADLFVSTPLSSQAAIGIRGTIMGWIKDTPDLLLNSGYALTAASGLSLAWRWKAGRSARCGLEDKISHEDAHPGAHNSAVSTKEKLLEALGKIPQAGQILIEHFDPLDLRTFLLANTEARARMLSQNSPSIGQMERFLFASMEINPRNMLKMADLYLRVHGNSWDTMPKDIREATLEPASLFQQRIEAARASQSTLTSPAVHPAIR